MALETAVLVEGGGGRGLPAVPQPQEKVPSSCAQRYISSRKLERAEAAMRVEKAFAAAGGVLLLLVLLVTLRTVVDGVVAAAGDGFAGAVVGCDGGDVSAHRSPELFPSASPCPDGETLAATRPAPRPEHGGTAAAARQDSGGEISSLAGGGAHRSTCA